MRKLMGAARRAGRFFRATFFLVLLLISSLAPRAQDRDKTVQELAQKIYAATGPHTSIALEVRNLSPLGTAEFARVRGALEGELRSRGARLAAAPPADAEVRVTLAENVQGYLWVAEIHRGDAQQVVMVVAPGAMPGAPSISSPALTLHKELVWQQPQPILDFVLPPLAPDGMPLLLVMEPERIAMYRFTESRWRFQQAESVPHQNPWPRDVRGRLGLDREGYNAGLPGVSCEGVVHRELTTECRDGSEAEDEWPLDAGGEERGSAPFTATRNYFTGLVTTYGRTEEKLPPFFSAAVMKSREVTHWILTGLDGVARLYEDSATPAAVYSGWGSEIAAVGSGCGAAWQVLVTRAGDWTQPDSVATYEIDGGQAVAVSQPVEFAGPIVSLWPATDGKTANAVVHDLKSGQYEAYSLSIICSH